MAEVESFETLLEKASTALDQREASEMKRILYGTHSKSVIYKNSILIIHHYTILSITQLKRILSNNVINTSFRYVS